MKKKTATNRQRNRAPKSDVHAWRRHHILCGADAFSRLIKQPISSALTWLVLAISLMLPTLFYVALQAIDGQTQAWQEGGQITLYLNDQVSLNAGKLLAEELIARPEILTSSYTSKDDAWDEFSSLLSLNSDLNLSVNPLPASVVIVPNQQNSVQLEALMLMLEGLPDIEDIQIDLAWINKLNTVLSLTKSVVQLLGLILGIAVLLIVGNTIRLSIESRKSEIQIIKLLGATDAFVRRPFMYLGFWYGVFGGIAAWVMLTMISVSLQPKLETFLSSYGLNAPSFWLSVNELGILLLASILVSLLGARIALWRHLKDTDPR